ncbi:unnamed protein product [Adineta ricciae]|uniref:NAD(P)(+)--arginine ADP-ribosyltransferase n=1 Tax=Adineta ricciae TaxID=249248 RepID=A0A814UZ06_ADIRI|nr:unnamed protein product [Adineta ricciae]
MDRITEYSVLWLDDKQNDPLNEYKIERSRLRRIIDYLKFFTQIEICIENIRIRSIYTYEENSNDEHTSDTTHVYQQIIPKMFKHPNDLLFQLSQDIRVFLRQNMEIDSTLPFSALSSNEERTTGLYSRTDIHWFPYIMEALQEIPPVANGKENFVNECRKLYLDNEPALKFINEFNDTYDSHMAVARYTREGILYQLFNRVLRQLDQHKIFLLHFFIYDLSQQLKKEADNSKDADWRKEPVYRGQRISKTEIEFLKEQRMLYLNTFLSTTKNLMLAEIYAGVGSHDSNRDTAEQPVIFKIGSCTWNLFGKSAASIDHLSHFEGAEDEVLFAPTYTFFPMPIVYDENTAVWNVTLLQLTETYDLRYEYLSYLVKLDACLRTIIVDNDTTNDDCALLVDHIISLIRELVIGDEDVVTLGSTSNRVAHTNVSRLELKGIALFAQPVLPRINSSISYLTLSMLYDCIATLFKCLGKYDLALENFLRAEKYATNQNDIHYITRKVKIAQIHKIVGNPSLAWDNFQEILPEISTDTELFERIFISIAMNKPLFKNEVDEQQNNRNVHQYLQYISTKADLKRFGPLIAGAYRDLSEYLFQNDGQQQQLIEFLESEVQIRKKIVQYDRSSRYDLAHRCKDLASLYGHKDCRKAIKYYREAVNNFKPYQEVGTRDLIAICWCEIGLLRPRHNVQIFINAFNLLLSDMDHRMEMTVADDIARCYMCLAKSYARSRRLNSQALETCLKSLRLLINHVPDDFTFSDEELDDCWEWALSLFKIKSDQDGSQASTKQQLYSMCKPSDKHPSLEGKEIGKMLKTTINRLQRQLPSTRKRYRKKRIKRLSRFIN